MTTPTETRATNRVLLALTRLAVGVSVRAAHRVGLPSAVQLRALTVVRTRGSTNLVRLTEAVGVTVSTTSRLVDRLVTAGLVDRRTSAASRREVSLSLTAHGAELLRRYDRLRVRELRRRLEALAPREQEAVLDALARLTGNRPGR